MLPAGQHFSRLDVEIANTDTRTCPRTDKKLVRSMLESVGSNLWSQHRYCEDLRAASLLYAAQGLEDDSEDYHQDHTTQKSFHHLGYTCLDTLHDPFLGGGQDLTNRQLSLSHVYMHDLAPAFMGNPTAQAPYSPAVMITLLCLKHSPAASQWNAILAEEMISAMSGIPRTTEMIVLRRSANRALKIALKDFSNNFQSAYLALLKAAHVSIFVGDTRMQQILCRAAELAIEAVGGLKRALMLTPDIEPLFLIAFPLYQASISTSHTFEQIVSRFFRALQQILQQNKPGQRLASQALANDVPQRISANEHYLHFEEEVIAALKPFISLATISSTPGLKSILFFLLELCWTFVVIGCEPAIGIETLRNTAALLKTCTSPQLKSQGYNTFNSTLAMTVAHARRDSLSKLVPCKRSEYDLFITQMEMDGYKIFNYPINPGRTRILAKLYSWLVNDSANGLSFSDVELDLLTSQTVDAWRQCHSRSA